MNYIEEITRIARENINKADDAGCGMFNFPLSIKQGLTDDEYIEDAILQVYPFKNNEYYGMVYIILYYKSGGQEDIYWKDLSDSEKEYIFSEFKKQIEGNEIKLNKFLKKDLSYSQKIRLIELWEDDRGSDGEFVFDLDLDEDAKGWIELYGALSLHECRKYGRYWMGGINFKHLNDDSQGNKGKPFVWHIDEDLAESFIYKVVIDDAEERFESYHANNDEEIEFYQARCYSNLIDFKSYYYEKHKKYFVWEASSEDGNFTGKSETLFDTEIEAYNSMRNAALEKMKWNTEWCDVDTESSIGYQVHFSKDKIVHESYSGIYTYKVRPASVDEIKGCLK